MAKIHPSITPNILYAPNVHTGGGLVLLQAILDAWPRLGELIAILDVRARDVLPIENCTSVVWVYPTVWGRLKAERNLRKLSNSGHTVLCFHGLPPLFPNKGKIFVFVQNRLLIDSSSLAKARTRTRLRITIERSIARHLRKSVAAYVVQTQSMRLQLLAWYKSNPKGKRLPEVFIQSFVPQELLQPDQSISSLSDLTWDFIYVASGDAHKNHRKLLEAWSLLADNGLRPSLALTLGSQDQVLIAEIETIAQEKQINIMNVGAGTHHEAMQRYKKAGALIYPSLIESFGLPLLEAQKSGTPILAPELDYVRDVCEPVETFDPNSAVSIARAVERFLGCPQKLTKPGSAAQFWLFLIDSSHNQE